MAKVMVSFPDELLGALDVEAAQRGMTRSGLLQELVEQSLRQRSLRRAERMVHIDEADATPAGHGGDVAELVKTNRPER